MADSDVTLTTNDINCLNKSRKRKLDPSKWKHNVKKRLRNTGQTYISKSGHIIPEKTASDKVNETTLYIS